MVELESRIFADQSKTLMKLTERMSNYLTLLSPPEKQKAELEQFFTERAKFDELTTQYNISLQDIQQKDQLIQQLKSQISDLQIQMRGMEDSLNAVSESLSIKDLNKQLQTELNTQTLKTDNLAKELNAIKFAYDDLMQKSEAFSALELELVKTHNKLQGEWQKNQQLRKTLQTERENIKTLESEKKGLEYALRRLERRLLQKGPLRGLSIPVHQLEISEDLSGKADAEIQEQIQTMNLELQKRLDLIKELEIRNQGLKEKLAKSSTRDLQLEVERLRSELESKNGTIMATESTKKKLMDQINNLQQRLADLQNKVMTQGKEIEEKDKNIKSLETAVSTGVHDAQARNVIQNLQTQNREFRNQVRDGEKIIRSLEKNIKFLQTQLKQQKEHTYKLSNQNHDQLVLIQKLQSALQHGGSTVDIDLPTIDQRAILSEDGPSLDDEIKERDRKIQRLESYVESLKQEVEDLQFRQTSRDIKIDELNTILREMKADLTSSKTKIMIRPPSTDESRKAKVKF
ncbi:MAG: hypothetical protein EU536_01010 [Promethearchaeota archaeon]|nr:MAG: hypothetical protein EU536_01010 [Candidatus Lokiarchaeota archaeon]